jgi:hypothetical protein
MTMFKTILNFIAGALIASAVGYGMAVTGTPPGTGPQLVDGAWLNGLAAGNNFTFQSGITAAGTTAATGTLLNTSVALFEIDTVAASTGVTLPFAVASDFFMIRNAGAQNLTVYANPGTNPATGTTDTINGTTSITINTSGQKSAFCFVAKTGTVSCVLSS